MRPSANNSFRPSVPTQLFAWLSPAFPVSGFAFSQGLETAVEREWITDRGSLMTWLRHLIERGSIRNDLILLSLAHKVGDDQQAADIRELSAALQPTAERAHEAVTQGASFRDAYRAGWALENGSAWASDDSPLALAVAIGFAARDHAIDRATTLEAYGVTMIGNLLSAAIRLGVIGQFDGQRIQAELLPVIQRACDEALPSTEDDLGSAACGADLASMLHETQTTRIFRS